MQRLSASRRRALALATLVAASAFSIALVGFRFAVTDEPDYANLLWNLVLAWAPFVFALVAYDADRRRARSLAILLPAVLWLAFLPNAPYLLTDFVLLRIVDGMPVWFDVVMLTSFAWTGLVLGFVSVYLMQSVARRHAGAAAGWLCALGSLGLSGLGIYLGRYLRWNSWDLVVQPSRVLSDVAERMGSARMVGMSLALAIFLTLAYAMLYTVLDVALDERD
ncbi:MAG: DUF1361 domain-containing protein [Actinobacteria bacterium]|nr:DUF1361 domain-containing protein [Actinomycetota bacterium]